MAKKQKQPHDPLAQARAKPASVKSIVINPAQARNMGLGEFEPYRVFPPDIFDCKNLVELDIFRGIAWDGDPRVPKQISSLTKLKKLGLGGLSFRTLPEELGKLKALESLELYYDEVLEALPSSIGKLAKLRSLECGYCEALAALPPTIGKLRALRTLNLSRTALHSVPKQLWQLTKLEHLHLPDELDKLPPGIGALTSLRELSLSCKALASIAKELPKLRELRSLSLGGKAKTLPAELATLASLEHLHASYLDLAELPSLAGLAKLKQLEISGNKLTTVLPLLAQLPKLEELEYSDNAVDKAERRAVDALMKRSPSKRKLDKLPVPKPAAAGPKPEMIGKITSINASLIMAVGDASVIATWAGIGDGSTDDLDDTDWDRARVAVGRREWGPVKLNNGKAAHALCLEMGSGVVEIFRAGDGVVLVEGIGDDYLDDELFADWLASPPKRARTLATVKLPTKTLALLPTTDAGTKATLEPGGIVKIGDEHAGRAIHLGHAAVKLALEPRAKSSWGEARRCFVTRG